MDTSTSPPTTLPGFKGPSTGPSDDSDSSSGGGRERKQTANRQLVVVEEKQGGKKGNFVDAAAMKEKVRQNMSKPKYCVFDFYYDTGICQKIARSSWFDKATLLVIAINALWISIDTDLNKAPILLQADPLFIVAENLFCTYFTFEWTMRFLSFRRKRNGLKDAWFVFDTIMVLLMVFETWLLSLYILSLDQPQGGGGNTDIMSLARLLRLARMARMGKLLRVLPELMVMIKGMMAAARSVCFTLGFLFIIMYIFGIAFVQLSADTAAAVHFPDVLSSIYTLLIHGIFQDSLLQFTTELKPFPILALLFYAFVLVGSLTLMNMLIGVLCEVVSAVAATEQEEMLVTYVHEKLAEVMRLIDTDEGGTISKDEFMQIIENVDAVRCMLDVGVDVFALVDLVDYIFMDENQQELELDFAKFMDVVLQLRGTNHATVKDIVDLRKFIRQALHESEENSKRILGLLQERPSQAAVRKKGTSRKAFHEIVHDALREDAARAGDEGGGGEGGGSGLGAAAMIGGCSAIGGGGPAIGAVGVGAAWLADGGELDSKGGASAGAGFLTFSTSLDSSLNGSLESASWLRPTPNGNSIAANATAKDKLDAALSLADSLAAQGEWAPIDVPNINREIPGISRPASKSSVQDGSRCPDAGAGLAKLNEADSRTLQSKDTAPEATRANLPGQVGYGRHQSESPREGRLGPSTMQSPAKVSPRSSPSPREVC
eukprot:TRINITY_DN18745_c0_g1_i1.p1 TRINITY_DN18745_c0_g1~~TRINITY_DN18745_c0_g1_i1.p1  ORF type:complete len:716 (-),score=122.51 TRINITY_DN18745_c0_g1_i1:41-2188(-)